MTQELKLLKKIKALLLERAEKHSQGYKVLGLSDGVVIQVDKNCTRDIGDYSSAWGMGFFTEYNGTLELSNEN